MPFHRFSGVGICELMKYSPTVGDRWKGQPSTPGNVPRISLRTAVGALSGMTNVDVVTPAAFHCPARAWPSETLSVLLDVRTSRLSGSPVGPRYRPSPPLRQPASPIRDSARERS